MLIFPSYYRRERPELVGHPAALVSYRFNGFLDETYATALGSARLACWQRRLAFANFSMSPLPYFSLPALQPFTTNE